MLQNIFHHYEDNMIHSLSKEKQQQNTYHRMILAANDPSMWALSLFTGEWGDLRDSNVFLCVVRHTREAYLVFISFHPWAIVCDNKGRIGIMHDRCAGLEDAHQAGPSRARYRVQDVKIPLSLPTLETPKTISVWMLSVMTCIVNLQIKFWYLQLPVFLEQYGKNIIFIYRKEMKILL